MAADRFTARTAPSSQRKAHVAGLKRKRALLDPMPMKAVGA
jgi:hypothetical protein